MADPEHVKIVKAGKEAIDKWWKENPEAPYTYDMRLKGETYGTMKKSLDLRNANLADIQLQNVSLKYVDFYDANLMGARFSNVDLTEAYCMEANLFGSQFIKVHCERTNFTRTSLITCTFKESDFSSALFSYTNCQEAKFINNNLSGIFMYAPATDEWTLENNTCTHFYNILGHGENKKLVRIPSEGWLLPGEFEDRFKSRPTIEFIFEKGMPVLGPAILDSAIADVNLKKPETGLRLLDISARGGIPRAIIEVAERVPKEDALALVAACYQQKFEEMQKEIDGLKEDKKSLLQITSKKILLPAMGCEGKNRPTAADMKRRNQAVAYAAGEIKMKHNRLPTVDEIIDATGYSRQQIYATAPYAEGKIARQFAKLTKDVIGSATESEQFKNKSTEHTRINRRSKSEQAELDALIDKQEEDDKSDRISTEKH
ncbi:MAG: pentapeptide repeat-containing protein [Planctomycetota bacterium]|jgi:hypothetical protein